MMVRRRRHKSPPTLLVLYGRLFDIISLADFIFNFKIDPLTRGTTTAVRAFFIRLVRNTTLHLIRTIFHRATNEAITVFKTF